MAMNEELYLKIITERKKTPNVMVLKTPGFNDGKKQIFIAPPHIRGFAQNIIDNVEEHAHLKNAKILLLILMTETNAKKLEKGEKISIGKASLASPREKLLTSIGAAKDCSADFIVMLSGDWLEAICATENGCAEITTDEPAIRKAIALIDHELSHCYVKIAGEHIDPEHLDGFVQDLGIRHIDTREDITDEKGHVLVRYQYVDKKGKIQWKVRGHDVEEFHGVIARHGAWATDLRRMVDVMIEHQPTLFEPQLAQKD